MRFPAVRCFLPAQQPGRFAAIEYLPAYGDILGDPTFFPESASEAAPVVARALLHSFVRNCNKSESNSLAPWSLMTEEPALAAAVGAELKKMGVVKALHFISVASDRDVKLAEDSFTKEPYGRGLRLSKLVTFGEEAEFLGLPTPRRAPAHPFQYACDYVLLKKKASPPRQSVETVEEYDAEEVQAAMVGLKATSTPDVKTKADTGDVDAALDYAIRCVDPTIRHTPFSHAVVDQGSTSNTMLK
jgi:hypothetical protein